MSQSFDTSDLSLDTAQRETEEFLTVQMPSTLSTVEYEMPLFSEEPNRQTLAHVTRGRVEVLAGHEAFGLHASETRLGDIGSCAPTDLEFGFLALLDLLDALQVGLSRRLGRPRIIDGREPLLGVHELT